MKNPSEASALAEGLYWMAEKLAWGYEETKPDLSQAFRLFKQAADLGFSDAYIRIGEFQEHGKGTARNANAALNSYAAAVKANNFFGMAFMAKLLSRSSHLEKAEKLWVRFFAALTANPQASFPSASRGEVLYDYISSQLRLGLEPQHRDTLLRYRLEIAAHHQRLLEHSAAAKLERLGGVFGWIESNLGPWLIDEA
jgi:TPR repeat protein